VGFKAEASSRGKYSSACRYSAHLEISPWDSTMARVAGSAPERFPPTTIEPTLRKQGSIMRKLIAFDDDTFDKLKQLGRGRMASLQELADEAFADLLRKHGIPVDLRDALRKSASVTRKPAQDSARSRSTGKSRP